MAQPPIIAVTMIRPDLEDIPEYALPAGFQFRWYRPGDEETWTTLEAATEKHFPIPPETFREQFGSDEAVLARGMVFIEDQAGHVVGTATAWHKPDHHGLSYGQVHWVAIADDYQGRGLAKPLMTLVCRRLRELGHERALLGTHAVRIPAINLYLHFGFRPEIRDAEQLAVWRAIGAQTKYPVDA